MIRFLQLRGGRAYEDAELFLLPPLYRQPSFEPLTIDAEGGESSYQRFSARRLLGAGAVGFEPTGVLPPLVFKTSALVRSAMPPNRSSS